MVKNHEIRFRCSKELFTLIDNLYQSIGKDFKRTSFYEKIFLLGIYDLQKQMVKNPESKKLFLQIISKLKKT